MLMMRARVDDVDADDEDDEYAEDEHDEYAEDEDRRAESRGGDINF